MLWSYTVWRRNRIGPLMYHSYQKRGESIIKTKQSHRYKRHQVPFPAKKPDEKRPEVPLKFSYSNLSVQIQIQKESLRFTKKGSSPQHNGNSKMTSVCCPGALLSSFRSPALPYYNSLSWAQWLRSPAAEPEVVELHSPLRLLGDPTLQFKRYYDDYKVDF